MNWRTHRWAACMVLNQQRPRGLEPRQGLQYMRAQPVERQQDELAEFGLLETESVLVVVLVMTAKIQDQAQRRLSRPSIARILARQSG